MRGSVRREANGTYTVVYDAGEQQRHCCTSCKWRTWSSGRAPKSCPECRAEVETRYERRQHRKRGFKKKTGDGGADGWLAAKIVEVESGGHVDPKKMTVRQFMDDRWLPTVEARLSPNTVKKYKAEVRNHINPALGSIRLQQLDRGELELWVQGLTKLNGQPLHPKSARNAYFTLNKALKTAVLWGLINYNPLAGVEKPVAKRRPIKVWSADEMRRFLEHTEGHPLYAAFMLFVTTGMRRAEVLGLRWCDIDWERSRISVEWTLLEGEGSGLLYKRPKSDAGRRRIAVDARTTAALREHRKAALQERLAAGEKWLEGPEGWSKELSYPDYRPDDVDLVFRKPNGDMLDPREFSNVLPDLAEEAGLRRIRLHDVRHSYATMMLKSSAHPKIVSQRLGHSVIAHTMDLYSWAQDSHDEQAAQDGHDLLFGGENQGEDDAAEGGEL